MQEENRYAQTPTISHLVSRELSLFLLHGESEGQVQHLFLEIVTISNVVGAGSVSPVLVETSSAAVWVSNLT